MEDGTHVAVFFFHGLLDPVQDRAHISLASALGCETPKSINDITRVTLGYEDPGVLVQTNNKRSALEQQQETGQRESYRSQE